MFTTKEKYIRLINLLQICYIFYFNNNYNTEIQFDIRIKIDIFIYYKT